jgi:hypothetical protein
MLQYSPKIITDSLVMCLDASQNKSYPTTDLPVKGGLALWLDAADDTTFSYSSGTSVSQWRDKSGNNRHFFQATAGNQPSRSAVVNSRKAIQFTAASSQYLRYNSKIINNTTGGSVFVAWRTAGETGAYSSILDNYHCGSNALGAGFQIERNVTNNQYYWGFQTSGCSNAGFIPATSYSNDTTNSVWITKDSTTITGGLNGTSVTPSSSPSATWIEDDKGWTIGAWGAGTESFGRFFNGINCEVIIFNRGLSPTEVKQINTYLGQKWGISNTDRSIVDLAGNDDNGLLGNGSTSNMPVYDYYNKGAFRFDGSNDFIKVGPNSSLQVNNVTIAAFFKTVNNGQSVQFIAGYGDTGIAGYWIGTSGGAIRFSIGGGSGNYLQQSSGVTPNNDQIYYVVGTYDGTNQRVYVNGVLQASATTVTGNISYTGLTDGFLLGQVQGFTAGRYLTGNIYNVSVYSRALSQAEISQNYEALKSKFANTIVQQGLVLNLDAGNPYSYAGSGTTWYDVSGGGYNATIVNAPTFVSDSIKYFTCSSTQNFTISNPISSQPNLSQIWTVSAWVNIDTITGASARYLISGLNNGVAVEWYDSGTLLYLNGGANDYYTYGSSIEGSGWVYLTFLFRNSDGYRKIYNNLIDITTSGPNNTSTPAGNSATFTIADNMRGKIAQIMMYDRLLTVAEIAQNYNATKGRFGL